MSFSALTFSTVMTTDSTSAKSSQMIFLLSSNQSSFFVRVSLYLWRTRIDWNSDLFPFWATNKLKFSDSEESAADKTRASACLHPRLFPHPRLKTMSVHKQKIQPFLWFDTQAEEAANFYCSIFKNSSIQHLSRYGEGAPGPATTGSVMSVSFVLDGLSFIALNGGPMYKFSEATSFLITADT